MLLSLQIRKKFKNITVIYKNVEGGERVHKQKSRKYKRYLRKRLKKLKEEILENSDREITII